MRESNIILPSTSTNAAPSKLLTFLPGSLHGLQFVLPVALMAHQSIFYCDPLNGHVISQNPSFQNSPMASPVPQNLTQCSNHYCLFDLAPMTSPSCFLPTLPFCPYLIASSQFFPHTQSSQLSALTVCFFCLACRDPQPGHSQNCLVSKPMLLSQGDFLANLIINGTPQITRLSAFSSSILYLIVLHRMDQSYRITYLLVYFPYPLRRHAFHERKDLLYLFHSLLLYSYPWCLDNYLSYKKH